MTTLTLLPRARTLTFGLAALLTSAAVLTGTAAVVQAAEAPTARTPATMTAAQWVEATSAQVDLKLDYPHSARVTGRSGVVTVAATVAPDGRIKQADVARSSGTRALDLAALRTVHALKLAPLPAATAPVSVNLVLGFGTDPREVARQVAQTRQQLQTASLAINAQ